MLQEKLDFVIYCEPLIHNTEKNAFDNDAAKRESQMKREFRDRKQRLLVLTKPHKKKW